MAAPQTPACPRCGYDQSGIVASWDRAGACPLDGTCSECGLTYLWMDVLVPARTVPRWSFEHATERRVSRLFATLATLLRPWRFWRDLRMSHPIRWRRLALLSLLCIAAAHLAASAAAAWSAHFASTVRWVNRGGTYTMAGPDNSLGTWLQPDVLLAAAFPLRIPYLYPILGHPALIVILQQASMALLLLVLSDTRAMARVRGAHIARAAAYSLPFASILCGYFGAFAWLYVTVRWSLTSSALPGAGVFLLWALAAAYILWTALYWWFVIRRYMMLPSALLVTGISYAVSWFAACVLWFAAYQFGGGY